MGLSLACLQRLRPHSIIAVFIRALAAIRKRRRGARTPRRFATLCALRVGEAFGVRQPCGAFCVLHPQRRKAVTKLRIVRILSLRLRTGVGEVKARSEGSAAFSNWDHE